MVKMDSFVSSLCSVLFNAIEGSRQPQEMAEDILVWNNSTAEYREVKVTGGGSFYLADFEVRE